MREIKFRAWDKKNKKMLYPGNEWYDICCGAIEGVLAIPHSSVYDGVENKSKEWIPMQYTGLKDKKGKEIYEGDIVKAEGLMSIRIRPVIFKNGMFCIPGEYALLPLSEYAGEGNELEVIGNIYENPNLLEEVETTYVALTQHDTVQWQKKDFECSDEE